MIKLNLCISVADSRGGGENLSNVKEHRNKKKKKTHLQRINDASFKAF